MKKLNVLLIAILVMTAVLATALPVRAASLGFNVTCTGAFGFGDVPAGHIYTWFVRFYDPGTNSGTHVVTDILTQGDIFGPAPFNVVVNWPFTPTTGNTQADSYYWVDIWNFGTGEHVYHAEGHFNCTPPPPPPPALEGCTPGYWKQSQHFNAWVGYAPADSFQAVFGRPVAGTLLDALNANGGGLNALRRHAVAALLNASNPSVDPDPAIDTTAEVIAAFQAAYDSGDYETTKNMFEASNEAGCPLN
jgi:hypothetical protein